MIRAVPVERGSIAFLRGVTGAADITFADAQATVYGPGHFLTPMMISPPKQQRRVAYVLNLTQPGRSNGAAC